MNFLPKKKNILLICLSVSAFCLEGGTEVRYRSEVTPSAQTSIQRGIFPPSPAKGREIPAFYPNDSGPVSILPKSVQEWTEEAVESRTVPANEQQAFLGVSSSLWDDGEEPCGDLPLCEEAEESMEVECPEVEASEENLVKLEIGECGYTCLTWLPCAPSFHPFIADPRETRFTASFRCDDEALGSQILSGGMGSTIPTLRINPDWACNSELELDVMAGAIAYWDVKNGDTDLIDHDYIVGVPLSFRYGNWALRARYTFVASYLQANVVVDPALVPLADLYRHSADLHATWEPICGLRYYLGGGYQWEHDDAVRSIQPWFVEAGGEIELENCRYAIKGLVVAPFLAMHLRWAEEHSWHLDASYALGAAWGDGSFFGGKLRTYFEVHDGYSPVLHFSNVKSTHYAVRASFGF